MTVTDSDRIAWLVGEAAAATTRLAMAAADERARLVPDARRDAARLSARLDASPLEDATADEVDRGERDPAGDLDRIPAQSRRSDADDDAGPADPRRGGWATALRLEGMPTQDVAALEYANLLAAFDAEAELAAAIFEAPLETLTRLHGIVCRGLVDADVVGRPRRTVQAIHDGAQGRVIYHPADPDDIPGLLEGLVDWLGRGSVGTPALLVAGTVQERLLQWQPFEAANGRLARAASRLVLRARGLDPDGLAVPERVLATDLTGYHAEVAATIRRRGNVIPWLERYGEALVAELTAAADAVAPASRSSPPARAEAVVDDLRPGEAVTLREYAAKTGVSQETARRELETLAKAGHVRLEGGTRGMRYRRR